MRIVAGRLRGRQLVVPSDQSIRPTSDRARESLFNILTHNWPEKIEGGRILDVFAGTGALGLEALSRGARFAAFIDNSPQALKVINANIEKMNVSERTRVYRRDAVKLGVAVASSTFDLVFMDPPYGKNLAPVAAQNLQSGGWLSPEALLVVEEKKSCIPAELDGFVTRQIREYGDTEIGFFQLLAN